MFHPSATTHGQDAGTGRRSAEGAHDLRRVLTEARVSWRRSVTARAALQTGSAAIGCMALLLILDLLFPLSVDVRSVLRWTPLIAALSCMAAAVRRLIMAPDDRKLALLVEERYPHLESTLSTLIDLVGESTVALAFRQRSKQLLPDVRAADAVPLPGRPLTITFVLAAVALALGLTLTGGGAESSCAPLRRGWQYLLLSGRLLRAGPLTLA